ncbi:hypothetical protein BJX99DRAFT_166436 [Aspergillus californicus]
MEIGYLRKENCGGQNGYVRFESGTPEDEASRRSETIDALFYNLLTGEIEDPTRRGIPDIQARVIRARLLLHPGVASEDVRRFKNDPCKILRLILLVARLERRGFEFRIAADIQRAMRDSGFRAAFNAKVNPELAGEHICRMMPLSNHIPRSRLG